MDYSTWNKDWDEDPRKQYRNACFTSFLPDPPVFIPEMKYLIYGSEICPDTGRHHWQGYCEFAKQLRFEAVKLILGKSVHFKARFSTAECCSNYCKKDGKFKEFGKISKPGTRNDLKAVIELIDTKASLLDVVEEFGEQYIKYNKGIEKMMFIKAKKWTKEFRHIKVIVHWGPPDTFKTRTAYESGPNVYKIRTSATAWWDGYDGEDTIILDEMCVGSIKWDELLEILDGYQQRLAVKGAFTYARWTTVYITSNVRPELWFPHRDPDDLKPLMRRITEIVDFTPASEVPSASEVVGNTILQPMKPLRRKT